MPMKFSYERSMKLTHGHFSKTAWLFSLATICSCTTRPQSSPIQVDVQKTDPIRHSEGNPRLVVPRAAQTIAKLRPKFRRCFAQMHASGKISLSLTIGPEGEVVYARATGPVPREVSHCVEGRAKNAHFSPTGGQQSALLRVPVAVYRQ